MPYPPTESKFDVIEVETRGGVTLVPRPTNDLQDPLVLLSSYERLVRLDFQLYC